MIVAGFSRPHPDEVVSGDGWLAHISDGTATICIVDGLGHGPLAGHATDEALAIFDRQASAPLLSILGEIDRGIRQTRGASMALARIAPSGRGEYCAVGNIGVWFSASTGHSLYASMGTVGQQLRSPKLQRFALGDDEVMVLYSDGVSSRLQPGPMLPRAPHILARELVRCWGKEHDDATAIVVALDGCKRLHTARSQIESDNA